MRVHVPLLIFTATVALAIGCGGKYRNGSAGSPTVSVVFPSAGGTVSSQGILFTVPAGAVPSDATISMASATDVPETDRVVSGTAKTFTSTTFAKPVRISYTLSNDDLENDPTVCKLIDGEWEPLPTTVDDSAHTATALIDSFSTYGVLGPGSATPSVTARAELATDGTPRIHVHWNANGFAGGNQQQAAWQIYRNDNLSAPIIVVSGAFRDAYDGAGLNSSSFTTYTPPYANPRPNTCVNTSFGGTPIPPASPLEVGKSYKYQVELVYRISGIDLPGGSGGSTGGTTGTTGGTTGNGGTGATADCYGMSTRASSTTLTFLNRPSVPTASGASFAFDSASPSGASPILYVVEASAQSNFSGPVIVGTKTSASTGVITVPCLDLSTAFPIGSTVYVRVGARGATDSPGPASDSLTGERFVFGDASTVSVP